MKLIHKTLYMEINVTNGSSQLKAILLLFLGMLINTLCSAQSKLYATDQTNQISGVCVGCSIQNPQNSVGSDENDYSSLHLGLALVGKVEQTLIFPTISDKRIIIGLGSNSNSLSVLLLNAVGIETMNGNVSNNDFRFIDNSILRINAQGHQGIVEVTPTKLFDRIKITYRTGLLSLNGGLQIYYAYVTDKIKKCTLSPDYIHYYTFNGNISDSVSPANNLLNLGTQPVFQNNMICDQGLSYSAPNITYTLKGSSYLNVPQPRAARTVSFWARIDQGGFIDLTIYGEKIKITSDSVIIKPVNENHNFPKTYFGRMFRHNPAPSGVLNLYTINFNNDPTPPYSVSNAFYQSNDKTFPPYYAVDVRPTVNGQGLPGPFRLFSNPNFLSSYPTTIETTHWAPYHTKGNDLVNNDLIISFTNAKIDEFIIYNNKIDPVTILNKYKGVDATFSNQRPALVEKEILTISPNPTTGQISIDGNNNLKDAYISVSNTAGMVVYQSKVTSLTFELPSNLPDGIYVLNIITQDKKALSSKVILRR